MDTSSAVEIGHVSSCVDEFYEMGWHGVANGHGHGVRPCP